MRLATTYIVQEPEMVLNQIETPEWLQLRTATSFPPWPQPSPRFPGVDADTVLSFPQEEKSEFATHILSRYTKQICVDWLRSAREALSQEGLDPVSDLEFCEIFDDSVFSKFLGQGLTKQEEEVFAPVLARFPNKENFLKVDFSAMERLKSIDSVYLAPTTTLFRRTNIAGEKLKAEAIWINGILLTPKDKHAWDLAKYFVLQGAAMTLVLLAHPRVHFPMDSINAITKTLLPKGHIVYELLFPHTWLTLPLNRRVQWSPHSLVHNDQDLIYCPFASTGKSNFDFKTVSISGLSGSSTYKPYRFPIKPEKIYSRLGAFFESYYETIFQFTKKVCSRVDKNDSQVKTWADFIAKHVYGFPNGQEIFEGDNLAASTAYYIFDVSVMHATEHFSYSQLPIRQVPLRLRVPPPTDPKMKNLDRSLLVKPIDVLRHSMARKMFFSPSNLSLLKDANYNFSQDDFKKTAKDFRNNLEATDRDQSRKFIPLDLISASIQY